MNKEKEALRGLSRNQLEEKVQGYRTGLFKLRLAATTGHIKDFSQFKKLRIGLARALTFLGQKDQ